MESILRRDSEIDVSVEAECPLPLRRGEGELAVDLGKVLHDLYDRASYDLRIDYEGELVPPLPRDDTEWAKGLLRDRGV